MDSSFVEFLNSQTKKFKQAIMRDYWDYRRTPANKTGFFCLKTTSSEYLLQKFFEKRLEEYIRRYLVNGFLSFYGQSCKNQYVHLLNLHIHFEYYELRHFLATFQFPVLKSALYFSPLSF